MRQVLVPLRGLASHDAADPFVIVHANGRMEFCIDVLTGMKDGPDDVYPHVFGKRADAASLNR